MQKILKKIECQVGGGKFLLFIQDAWQRSAGGGTETGSRLLDFTIVLCFCLVGIDGLITIQIKANCDDWFG